MNHLVLKQLTLVPEQLHNSPDRAFPDTELNLDVLAGFQDAVSAAAHQLKYVLDLSIKYGSRIIHTKYHQLCLGSHLTAVFPDDFSINLKQVHSGRLKREFLRLAGERLARSQILARII